MFPCAGNGQIAYTWYLHIRRILVTSSFFCREINMGDMLILIIYNPWVKFDVVRLKLAIRMQESANHPILQWT